MNSKLSGLAAVVLCLAIAVFLVSGCGKEEVKLPQGAAADDVLTFENNAANKPVIRIGMQYYTPDNNFIETLEKRFPEYVFVLDYCVAAGTGQEERLVHMLEAGLPLDLVVSGRLYFMQSEMDMYCDLSAESFLNNYLLASLNNVGVDGKIYFLPGVTSLTGIAYNTRMFKERNWQAPNNIEEFFALCETIKQAGVKPFSNCCKYAGQVSRLFGTMLYDKLYTSDEDIIWRQNVQQGKATFKGHMEPFYELAKRFADEGIITLDDFSASLTKQRRAFWDGEYAMMYGDTGLYTYGKAEGASFDIGFMPFPAEAEESSGYSVMPNYYMAIPKRVEQDPQRLEVMKELLAYLSTAEGQHSMLSGNYNISNVKGVDISENPAFEYIRGAYERGNLYPHIEYTGTDVEIINLQQESVKSLYEGATVDEAISLMDDSLHRAFTEGAPKDEFEVIAQAESDFTMLETSYYIADKLREAAASDIALMIDRGYFRSNLATIDKGDITSDMRRFVMKGTSGDDCLTTYEMTGRQIKELMEHPVVNGAEIDALYACSGLNIEYAPWNERGSRVLKLTFEDGKAIEDDKTYAVAAWAGAVDERYITRTIETHEAQGPITDILLSAIKRDKTIKPDIVSRVKLVWPEVRT